MRLGSLGWLSGLGGLGRAFIDVLEAEWSALTADLGRSGRILLRGLAIVVVALVILGWVAGLLSLALIFFLDQYLPTWAAVLIVAAALTLLALALLLWGRSVLDRFEPPTAVVQSHVEGHVEWVRGEIRRAAASGEEADDGVRGSG